MTPTALVILALSLTTAGGLGWGLLEHRGRVQERVEAQEAAQEAAGALAACKARTVPETVQASAQGTTDALTVALAADIEEVRLRSQFVTTLTDAGLSEAFTRTASPRMIAADRGLARCAGVTATQGADLMGCGNNGPIVKAWVDAIVEQAGCPEPVRE